MGYQTHVTRKKRPTPPASFSRAEKAEFRRICDDLESVNKLHTADHILIAKAAKLSSICEHAEAHMAEEGAVKTFEHNNTQGVSPHFRVWSVSIGKLITCLTRLGLAPNAREADPTRLPDDGDLDF